GIALFIAESEWVERHRRDRDIEPGLVVEHRFEPRHRPHAHVVIGAGDNELVRFDVLVEDELSGVRTFDPQIFWRLAAREVIADFRPDAGDPVHDAVLSGAYMDRPCTAGNGEEIGNAAASLSGGCAASASQPGRTQDLDRRAWVHRWGARVRW